METQQNPQTKSEERKREKDKARIRQLIKFQTTSQTNIVTITFQLPEVARKRSEKEKASSLKKETSLNTLRRTANRLKRTRALASVSRAKESLTTTRSHRPIRMGN